jgi:hypothetical protein
MSFKLSTMFIIVSSFLVLFKQDLFILSKLNLKIVNLN